MTDRPEPDKREEQNKRQERHKRWFLPETPDVVGMLNAQAVITVGGLDALEVWATGDTSAAEAVRGAMVAAFAEHKLQSDCWISGIENFGARVVKA